MQASEAKLQLIIGNEKQYVVPLFQRKYSWDKKEWGTLLDDLVELSEGENTRTHFIGSLVTMPINSVPEGVSKYLLIDGQQRLTTIFILLALLRDNAKKENQEKLADQIDKTLLTNPYENGTDDYYKLLPTQSDRAAFKRLINAEDFLPDSLITKAYQYFQKKLQEKNLDVQTLKRVIFTNLSVVSIVLGKDDDPHLVFESLNAKGRPLTQADLIRNYFFMKIHVNEQDHIYERYWKPMQDALEQKDDSSKEKKDNLTEFIRHYIMKDGIIIKQSDIYFSIKESINKSDALECLKDLARFATYYEKLLNPKKEEHTKIQKALHRLNRIEVTTAYPLLLNFYDDYAQNRISTEEFITLIKTIEN